MFLVNYFLRKLGVFSIIAPDFRRDTAPVSVAAQRQRTAATCFKSFKLF